jgi:hypothetical protein
MSSISCRVPLLSKSNNEHIVIDFEICPLYIDEKQPKSKTKKVDEYSIQIIAINELPVSKSAIARTEQLEYGGTVLVEIEYEGEIYLPEDGIYYWFPSRPKKLIDGSIRIELHSPTKQCAAPTACASVSRIYHPIPTISRRDRSCFAVGIDQNTTEIKYIYAYPLNSLPFMDLTGAFRYEYIAIAYTKNNGETHTTKMPVIMVEIDDRFLAMIDNATGIAYSIERTKTFREVI